MSRGNMTMQNPYMGFLISIPHSRKAICNILFTIVLTEKIDVELAEKCVYDSRMMRDIPGRRPSNF